MQLRAGGIAPNPFCTVQSLDSAILLLIIYFHVDKKCLKVYMLVRIGPVVCASVYCLFVCIYLYACLACLSVCVSAIGVDYGLAAWHFVLRSFLGINPASHFLIWKLHLISLRHVSPQLSTLPASLSSSPDWLDSTLIWTGCCYGNHSFTRICRFVDSR